MNPIKPTNAVVAVTDLLASAVQEYESRLAEKDQMHGRLAAQLKHLSDRDSELERLLCKYQIACNEFSKSESSSMQLLQAEMVSEWLSELQECLSPSLPHGPSGSNGPRNKPSTSGAATSPAKSTP